jgi:cytochrome c oxidase subunit 3
VSNNLQAGEQYTEELKRNTEYTGVHPQKFALWLAMASMTMFFAGLTSAIILRRGDFKSWEAFKFPFEFIYSTVAVLAVSIFMHLALLNYRKAKFSSFRSWLSGGAFMAVVFLLCQLNGLRVLNEMGKPMIGSMSGAFIHMMAYVHGFHIVVAILITFSFLFFAFRAKTRDVFELKNAVNPKRQLQLELLVSFWHYIDIVWIYLYVFFYLNYK